MDLVRRNSLFDCRVGFCHDGTFVFVNGCVFIEQGVVPECAGTLFARAANLRAALIQNLMGAPGHALVSVGVGVVVGVVYGGSTEYIGKLAYVLIILV